KLTGGSSTIRGLVINRWGANGIEMTTLGGNTVAGNYIGTDVSGTSAMANTGDGVLLGANASNNTIGGTTAGSRNIISGNTYGVSTFHTGGPASNNQIVGNYIGGLAVGAGNLISGNNTFGIRYFAPAIGQTIQGNYVGTNAAGTAAIPNGYGMFVGGDASISPVGTDVIERNLVSGNMIVG